MTTKPPSGCCIKCAGVLTDPRMLNPEFDHRTLQDVCLDENCPCHKVQATKAPAVPESWEEQLYELFRKAHERKKNGGYPVEVGLEAMEQFIRSTIQEATERREREVLEWALETHDAIHSSTDDTGLEHERFISALRDRLTALKP